MTDNPDRAQTIIGLVSALCAAYQRDADESTFLAYELGLEGVPEEALKRAFQRALQEDVHRMPTPARLRELSGESKRTAVAGVAWTEALKVIRGQEAEPDPLRDQVIDQLGGYERLGIMDRQNLHAYERQKFEARYLELWRIVEEHPQALEAGAAKMRGLLEIGKLPAQLEEGE